MLQPILDRVAIKPLKEKYEGQIVIPDTVSLKTRAAKGIVRGIGGGVKEPGFKVGDTVLFHVHPNIKNLFHEGVYLIKAQEVFGTIDG